MRVLCVWMVTTQPRDESGRVAREAGVPVVADLDEIYPGVDALIEKIDYLVVSRDFPCRLTGESSLKAALREIQTRYGCLLTAATLGPDGVLAWDGEQFHYAAAYRVPVVDTTGAGDIFHAGFLSTGCCKGGSWNASLIFPAPRLR